MANNTTLNLMSGGDVIADEDIGPGVKYQLIKLVDGTVGSTTPIKGIGGALVVVPTKGTATITQSSVAATTTANTVIVAASTSRVGLMIYNEGTAPLTILFGTGTQSATVYSLVIPGNTLFEVPDNFCQLRIAGNWTAIGGAARITELN